MQINEIVGDQASNGESMDLKRDSFSVIDNFVEFGKKLSSLAESVNVMANPGAAENESNSDEMDHLKTMYRLAIERAKMLEHQCQKQDRYIAELKDTISCLIGGNAASPIVASSVSPNAALHKSDNELQNLIGSRIEENNAAPIAPSTLLQDAANDVEYVVDEIVDVRKGGNQLEYKVRWEGFSPVDDSWEPEDHLHCDEKIDEFWRENSLDRKKMEEEFQAKMLDGNVDCEADVEEDDLKKDTNYKFSGRLNVTETRKSSRVSKPFADFAYRNNR